MFWTLLGVVVLKPFTFDLPRLDGVARLVSFPVAGVLLLAIGDFSPVPPRREGAGGGDVPPARLRGHAVPERPGVWFPGLCVLACASATRAEIFSWSAPLRLDGRGGPYAAEATAAPVPLVRAPGRCPAWVAALDRKRAALRAALAGGVPAMGLAAGRLAWQVS